jgi:hypothetical protein
MPNQHARAVDISFPWPGTSTTAAQPLRHNNHMLVASPAGIKPGGFFIEKELKFFFFFA